MEEGIICESKSKVRKVDSDEEDSDFECYDRSEEKPVHVDIDKQLTEANRLTVALLANRSDGDKIHIIGETRDRDGNKNLRITNRIFEPVERLGCVPWF